MNTYITEEEAKVWYRARACMEKSYLNYALEILDIWVDWVYTGEDQDRLQQMVALDLNAGEQ